MRRKQLISGIVILILLLISLFGAMWVIDKHNFEDKVIDVYGDSFYECGLMYGSRIKSVFQGIERLTSYLEEVTRELTSINLTEYILGYLQHTPDYLIEMMHGLADSTGVSFEHIALLNGAGDLFQSLIPVLMESMPLMGCSEFAALNNTAPGIGPIYGHNLDYALGSLFENWQIIMRFHPPASSGMNAIIGQAVAGQIGFQCAMNSAGLCVGATQVGTQEKGRGTPMSLVVLDTLLNSSNTFDAVQYLTNGTRSPLRHAAGWTYMCVDRDSVAAVVEVTNQTNYTRWHTEGDYMVQTNHFRSAYMSAHGTSAKPTSWRYRVLDEILMNKSNFDLQDAVDVLRSHYDLSIQGDPGNPYGNCICNDAFYGTMGSFIAAPLQNYTLACLTNPARGAFYLISFNEVFGPVA